jgi:hypothetical protein
MEIADGVSKVADLFRKEAATLRMKGDIVGANRLNALAQEREDYLARLKVIATIPWAIQAAAASAWGMFCE